jgi:hypothetical protein
LRLPSLAHADVSVVHLLRRVLSGLKQSMDSKREEREAQRNFEIVGSGKVPDTMRVMTQPPNLEVAPDE